MSLSGGPFNKGRGDTSLYSKVLGAEYDRVRLVAENLDSIVLMAQHISGVLGNGDIVITGDGLPSDFLDNFSQFTDLENRVTVLEGAVTANHSSIMTILDTLNQNVADSQSQTDSSIDQIETDIGTLQTDLAQALSDALAYTDTVTGNLSTTLNASIDSANTLIAGLRTDHDALVLDVAGKLGTAEVNALIQTETDARIAGDQASIDTFALLGAKSGDGLSFILDQNTVNVSPTESLATRLTTIAADIGTNDAAITTEATARADGDSALANTISLLDTRVGDNEASLLAEYTVRANADTANANAITLLTARVDTAEADIIAEQTARADADSATATTISGIQADVASNSASIITEQTARADGDSALALQISLLTAGVEGGFDPKYVWYFDSSDDGFTGNNATLSTAAGHLVVDSTGNSYIEKIISPSISGGQYPVVKLRFKRTSGSGLDGKVYFREVGGSFVDSGLTLDGVNPAVDDYTTMDCDLNGVTAYANGDIDGIRIYLGVDATDDFEVDWVGVGRNGPAASSAAIAEEAAVRASEDAAIASDVTALTARVTSAESDIVTNAAAIVTEQTARADGDSANATAITNLAASTATDIGNNTAAIAAETTARTNADTAIASDVTALTARVDTAEADILTEQTARSDGDSALASQITALETSTDTDIAANAAAIAAETTARTDADSALATQITNLETSTDTDIAANAAAIAAETTARTNADSALATDITNLTASTTTDIANNAAAITAEATARTNADDALSARIDTVEASSGNSTYYQDTAPVTAVPGDLWFDTDDNNAAYRWSGSSWDSTTDTRIFNNAAAITAEQTARASGDAANATDITNLTARVTTAEGDIVNNAADITAEQTARADGDAANASSITTLSGRVDTAEADIVTEQTARANGDIALATDIALLGAANGGGTAFILNENTVEVGGGVSLGTRLSGIDTAVGDNAAAITTEQTARADGDSALAASISTLTSTVNGNTASITTNASAIGGLESRYGVQLDVNGYVTGFSQNNDGTTGSFVIVADQFKIVDPAGGGGQAGTVPFQIDNGDVKINGNLVVDGTITTNSLEAGAVTNGASNYTAASSAVGQNSWWEAQNCQITTSGGDVRVDFCCSFSIVGSNTTVQYRVKRGSTVIRTGVLAQLFSDQLVQVTDSETFQVIGTATIPSSVAGTQAIFVVDTSAPAGTHTYSVELYTTLGGGVVESRQMGLLETKR